MGKRLEEAIKRYNDIQEQNLVGGGIQHIERQHNRGKLTARERIDVLIDPGTFNELGSCVGTTGVRMDGRQSLAPCDGAVVGTALVHGRSVMIYAPDFTVLGGSTAAQHLFKFAKTLEMAARWGMPMVNLLDSSGGRLGHTDVVMAGIDWHFRIQALHSGVIPQITVLMGPCIAGGAYLPTLCDFLLMSRVSANMWLGGPRQTQAATSEVFDKNVGGADYHMQLSGSADTVGDDDEETINQCRELLRYLPQNFKEKPPLWERNDDPLRETETLNVISSGPTLLDRLRCIPSGRSMSAEIDTAPESSGMPARPGVTIIRFVSLYVPRSSVGPKSSAAGTLTCRPPVTAKEKSIARGYRSSDPGWEGLKSKTPA